MNITRWNPFAEMEDLLKTYNRALAQNPSQEGVLSADWSPSVDIVENDDEFLIKAELPGVPKDDISVDVNNGVVTISGERKNEYKDEKEHRIERFYGRFSRSFSLPENVDETRIEAESKDGVLIVHLPKAEEAKPKKISVSIK